MEWQMMMFIETTNVVASQPPKGQLTGTPYAHAKIENVKNLLVSFD